MKDSGQQTTRLWAVLIGVSLALSIAVMMKPVLAAEPAPKSATANPKAKPDANEKAIRATADDFIKAFNAGDAKIVGGLWAEDAEYADESRQTFEGRAAIEKQYASLFEEHPGATITLSIESIRFPAPDVAIEKGVARVKSPSGGETASRYSVMHVKRDGHWTMSVGRDDPYIPTSNEEYLKDLDWLIGEWMPDGKENGPRIKSEWMAQKNFIRNTYATVNEAKNTLTSVQIIGWNPKIGAVVSWHFDANGGFGNDVWSKDGSKWVIEATGVSREGNESFAVNLLTPIDADSFSWQSVRRTLNDASLPDTALIKMARVPASKSPPAPKQ